MFTAIALMLLCVIAFDSAVSSIRTSTLRAQFATTNTSVVYNFFGLTFARKHP